MAHSNQQWAKKQCKGSQASIDFEKLETCMFVELKVQRLVKRFNKLRFS